MANQEHLHILLQGSSVWNKWREKYKDVVPDLRGADLLKANFCEADLHKADLSSANLVGADLSSANLRDADLRDADLRSANLRSADLRSANLRHAYLSNADLREANLNGANLSSAYLREAILSSTNLSGANLSSANLRGTNLSESNLSSTDLSSADLNSSNLHHTKLYRAYLGKADLREANLSNADLREANLRSTNFYRADLREADFSNADLIGTNLTRADLHKADLSSTSLCEANLDKASLYQANLNGADLRSTDLSRTNLSEANLNGANLSNARLIETNLSKTSLTNCSIYGVSVWNVNLEGAKQENLVITSENEPIITADNLEVAQFIYLLLNNQKLRQTIDTITSQVVLLLGCFPPGRREVRDALSKELRDQKYSPVVFDFEEAGNKDFRETVRTLANLARFVLIDLTGLDETIREIADEIVPRCVVPIRPLLLQGSHGQGYELFRELQHKHRWVLAPYRYKDLSDLHVSFQEKIIESTNEKIIELRQKKPLKMFLGYDSEDKNTLKTLKTHLRPLARAGLIEVWDDQDVAPGEEKGKEIERHLSDARIILLLISPAFLSSQDCYDIQISMAIERHEQGAAQVIPILLRPCAWQSTPLKNLQPLPKDGKPISRHNKDEVFFEVSEDIGEVIKSLG